MQLYKNYIFLITLFNYPQIQSVTNNRIIDFTIEDDDKSGINNLRHLHNIRHTKGTSHSHPYLTASSTVVNSRNPNYVQSFSLNCPHVADSSNENLRIEVVWTLNETVWLKIENGQQKVINGESTFSKRRVGGKTVMRILLNSARYKFDYNEIIGDFSMEISPVILSMDSGSWQCHVNVWQKDGKSHTLTSRRRIRIHPDSEKIEKASRINKIRNDPRPNKEPATLSYTRKNDNFGKDQLHIQKRGDRSRLSDNAYSNIAAFSRQNEDAVFITRKEEDTINPVIFARTDRQDRQLVSKLNREHLRRMDAQIDYELDMEDGLSYGYPGYENIPRARERSALYFNTSINNLSYRLIFSLLIIFVNM